MRNKRLHDLLPRGENAFVDQIWVIQYLINPAHPKPFPSFEIFRTYGLDVNEIRKPYFSGSPVLLTKFLSDMYLEKTMYGMDEAEALAHIFCGKLRNMTRTAESIATYI